MSKKRIEKLRRWATGKSVDMDMSLTWDDARLLLGRIDELLAERALLLAVVEEASSNKTILGRAGAHILTPHLDAYHASKEDGDE